MNTNGSCDQPSIRNPDSQWLSTVLGSEVTIKEKEEIGSSRGFLSTTWRLVVSSKEAGVMPNSLVLKSQSSNPIYARFSVERRSFEREIAFYQELAPIVPTRIPKVIATGDADDLWLLMEDLSGLRAGDQVRGLSQHEVRAVARQIARIHATFWEKQTVNEIAWLPAHVFWFSEVDNRVLEPFITEYGRRIGERMVTVLKAVIEQLPAIDRAFAERPFTLIHGDLRADNLLFDGQEDNPEAVILDWATASRSLGALDLAYLVGGSEPEAERASHITELLYLWHGELEAHGVSDYSLSEAQKDFQLSSLRCLAAALRLYATLHHESTSVRAALFRDESIERYFDLAESVEAWKALPSPLTDSDFA